MTEAGGGGGKGGGEASGFLGERGGGWERGDEGDERGKGIAAKSERERGREPGLEGKPAASGRGRGGGRGGVDTVRMQENLTFLFVHCSEMIQLKRQDQAQAIEISA